MKRFIAGMVVVIVVFCGLGGGSMLGALVHRYSHSPMLGVGIGLLAVGGGLFAAYKLHEYVMSLCPKGAFHEWRFIEGHKEGCEFTENRYLYECTKCGERDTVPYPRY